MRKINKLVNDLIIIFSLTFCCNLTPFADTGKKDLVLLLENTESMRINDPDFFIRRSVANFLQELTGDTQIAIILFNEGVSPVIPLTPLSEQTRGVLISNLKDRFSYAGAFRNSAAGLERALYELKTYGRPEAEKVILFVNSGEIETGDEERNYYFSRWAQEYLAAEAVTANIKVFGIAFTETADIHFLQKLAHTTGGVYYRVPEAKDALAALHRIRVTFSTLGPIIAATPTVETPPLLIPKKPTADIPTESTAPLAMESLAPEKQPPMADSALSSVRPEDPWLENYRVWFMQRWEYLTALFGLIAIALLIPLTFIRRSRSIGREADSPPSAKRRGQKKYILSTQSEDITHLTSPQIIDKRIVPYQTDIMETQLHSLDNLDARTDLIHSPSHGATELAESHPPSPKNPPNDEEETTAIRPVKRI